MIFEKLRFFKEFLGFLIRILDFLYSKYKFRFLFILRRNLLPFKTKVIFICEEKSWAVLWIAKNLTETLKELKLVSAEIASPLLAKNKILHWGAINYLIKIGITYLQKQNFNILNWYHVLPNDKRLKLIPYLNKYVDVLVTASPITKKILVDSGFNEKRIVIIPFGIDLSHFKKYDEKKKRAIREKFKISDDEIVIGSFQKDGEGWGDGMEPKMVKGPDIFCDVIKLLKEKYNIHVFLTGPSRGYVKKRLEEYQVPYTHLYLDNYMDIVYCYNILDLYIVPSRVEGGPQALLESMATGVPLVTTKVGMAPYMIKNGFNGFITNTENLEELYQNSVELIENKKLRDTIIENALNEVKKYDWEKIANQYYNKVYKDHL